MNMRKTALSLLLVLIMPSIAIAEEKMTLKFVFPFGEHIGSAASYCPSSKQTTLEGCCDAAGAVIYSYAPGQTACCKTPNSIRTEDGVTRCCVPPADSCPTGTLYDYTSVTVCGKCCPSHKIVETVGAYQDCCDPCTDGKSRFDQTTANPCGVCKCPNGQYHDGTTCQPCAPNCLDCDNGTSCNQCAATHPIWNGAFCTGCPVCP